MSTIETIENSPTSGRTGRASIEAVHDRLAAFAIVAFALAAPWSIAAAQIAVGLGILSLVVGLVISFRGTHPTQVPEERPEDAGQDPPRSSAWSERSRWRPRVPGRPWPGTWPWTFRLIGLFLCVQVLSILASIDPMHALRSFRGSWTYLFPVIFFLLLRGRPERARLGMRVLVVSAGLAGLYAVFQATTGTSPLDGEVLEDHGGIFMASGTLGHHLTFSGVMLPVFFLALGLASETTGPGRDPLPRWLRWLAVFAIAAGVLLCFARSGWIGLAAGLLVFTLRFGPRAVIGSVTGLAAVAAGAYLLLPAIRGRIATVGPASGPRFHLWESAWNIGIAHPWIGGGLGSWKDLFPLHRVPGEYISIAHPHNDLLNVLVETGFPGALLWLGIWIAFFFEVRPRDPLTMGTAAAVAALLVAGAFQCFITDEEVAQVWMFVLALGLTLRGTRREENGVAA